MSNHTEQFEFALTPSGKKAFKAHLAVWGNLGDHVVIASPTLARLKKVYRQIAGEEVIVGKTHEVWIVNLKDQDADAPRVKPVAQTWPCSVAGCTRLAAFIIDREMFCAEHRPAK